MAFYYSKRKLKVREEEHTGELNIVPYLDILMNLIIFLLLSINGLAAFGILNVNAPSYGPSAGGGGDTDKPEQILSVLISKKGFYIAGSGGVLGQEGAQGGAPEGDTSAPPTIPVKADGTYDFTALQDHMKAVKAHESFRAQTKVIIGAEADVAYENLIGTMDAVRETKDKQLLFPDVTLAAM